MYVVSVVVQEYVGFLQEKNPHIKTASAKQYAGIAGMPPNRQPHPQATTTTTSPSSSRQNTKRLTPRHPPPKRIRGSGMKTENLIMMTVIISAGNAPRVTRGLTGRRTVTTAKRSRHPPLKNNSGKTYPVTAVIKT